MDRVRPKKHLGQHFLNDLKIAQRISETLSGNKYSNVLEVGPGTGVLTRFLLNQSLFKTHVAEIDHECVAFLKQNLPELEGRIIEGDFLKLNLSELFNGQPFALIGNYPYSISSQIIFKMLEYKELIPEMAGMFQKEVAERICAQPNSRNYGVLSVLTQAFYDTEYLFTVNETAFNPPPKVKSGVVRLIRKENQDLGCNFKLFKSLVKQAFNQRRKMLRNSLGAFGFTGEQLQQTIFSKRPEQLSLAEFIDLVKILEGNENS